jgi:hypothetical protein
MLHVVEGTPPAEECRGHRDLAGSHNAQSVTGHSAGDKGRSVGYSCWYFVGRAQGCDVYWHPGSGLAIERDHSYLESYTGPVEFLVDRRLAEEVAINPALIQSMPEDLHLAFLAKEEEAQALAAQDWADTQVKDEMRAHVARTEVF